MVVAVLAQLAILRRPPQHSFTRIKSIMGIGYRFYGAVTLWICTRTAVGSVRVPEVVVLSVGVVSESIA